MRHTIKAMLAEEAILRKLQFVPEFSCNLHWLGGLRLRYARSELLQQLLLLGSHLLHTALLDQIVAPDVFGERGEFDGSREVSGREPVQDFGEQHFVLPDELPL